MAPSNSWEYQEPPVPTITMTRSIRAPKDKVFRVVSDIREYAKVQPQIVDVQLLTPQQQGVGTRFRETRVMGRTRASTDLEVTEYVEGERVRMVALSGGTLWDTVFTVRPSADGTGTDLSMTMDAKAQNVLARLMNTLIFGVVKKGVASDMDRVKAACEA